MLFSLTDHSERNHYYEDSRTADGRCCAIFGSDPDCVITAFELMKSIVGDKLIALHSGERVE